MTIKMLNKLSENFNRVKNVRKYQREVTELKSTITELKIHSRGLTVD